MLAQADTTELDRIASRIEISETLHSTILDTRESVRAPDAPAGADGFEPDTFSGSIELDTPSGFSRNSAGRMQQMELENMNDGQSSQQWLKIRDALIQSSNFIGMDMAARMNESSVRRAESERTRQAPSDVGRLVGNEQGAVFR